MGILEEGALLKYISYRQVYMNSHNITQRYNSLLCAELKRGIKYFLCSVLLES